MIEILITEIEPENAIYSGVLYKSTLAGLISPQEEHTARLERNLRLEEWYAMDVYERALVIANRRIRMAEHNLQADAEIIHAKHEAKKVSKK